MANTSSAKKAARSAERKAKINLKIRNSMKEAKKAVVKAIQGNDKKSAQTLLPQAYKRIDKAAKMRVIHKSAASRYKSRLTAKVKSLSK